MIYSLVLVHNNKQYTLFSTNCQRSFEHYYTSELKNKYTVLQTEQTETTLIIFVNLNMAAWSTEDVDIILSMLENDH